MPAVTRSSRAQTSKAARPSIDCDVESQSAYNPDISLDQKQSMSAGGLHSGTKRARSVPAKKLSSASQSSRQGRRKVVKRESIDRVSPGEGLQNEEMTGRISVKAARSLPQTAKALSRPKGRTQTHVTAVSPKFTPSPKKSKQNIYGLIPGETPYPNWPHPTPAECEEVHRLLSALHGDVKPPKSIPAPSLSVSGCGEVPSVLDALVRTRLSAATSNTNSSRAFSGLVAKFGVIQDGPGKGSVDWDAVRVAPTKAVFDAIKSGGLADVKSKDIKAILQMVWEENQSQTQHNTPDKLEDADHKPAPSLSLDHLHQLPSEEAFKALTRYPGIGPKTASCVLLFCLQRPSFAVDTHVFRLCKWLGWVPPAGSPSGQSPGAKGAFVGPSRESTFAHCEVRIPDRLKYPLHYLLVRHGRTCPRCRAVTGENSKGWEHGCVIEHLVKRTGVRKDQSASAVAIGGTGKRNARSKKRKLQLDSSDEASELTELESSELSELEREVEVR